MKRNAGLHRNKSSHIFLGFLVLVFTACTRIASAQDLKPIAANLGAQISASGRKTVAVVDFTDLKGNVTELGRFLAEEVSVDLVGVAKGYEVIDRTHLKAILQEHKLASTGLIDPQTARRLGQLAGVDALVTGTITPLGETIRLSAKVLDTETAKMIAASTTDIPKTPAIDVLLKEGVGAESGYSATNPDAAPNSGSSEAHDITLEGRELLFTIRGCWRAGNALSCSGAVRNKSENRRKVQIEFVSLVDDLGNQYDPSKVPGFGIGRRSSPIVFGSGGDQQELEPGLPVNFSFSMEELKPTAAHISIVMNYSIVEADGRWLPYNKLTFRNIVIQKK